MWPSMNKLVLLWLTVIVFPSQSQADLTDSMTITDTQIDNATNIQRSATKVSSSRRRRQCKISDELKDIIKEAVILSYRGNLENFNSVLNFVILTISDPNLKYTGLNTLFNELASRGDQHTSQMMTLTYWIKTFMSAENIDDQLFSNYNSLKRKIPSDIRSIMFGEYIRIVNVENNEYMYESNDRVDGHRLILTWVPGGPSTQDVFYFDVRMNEFNTFYFIIRNDYFDLGSPMCQSSSYYSPERRKIVTCPKNERIESGMLWLVDPIVNTTYFRLINFSDGTQLYSPVNSFLLDNERRYVFTWQRNDWGGGRPGYWTVEGI